MNSRKDKLDRKDIRKYQLGISDGWLAMRIEKMIENGKLQIITNAPSDCPAYHRVIRKIT
ncbi:MAG: DUF3658 domain-containing protein [[Clostridium] scindens]